MARRYNTAAIQTGAAGADAVGDAPDWLSVWTAETAGTFLRSIPLSVEISTLALGERIELAAGALSVVKSPSVGTLVAGARITNGGTGYTSAPVVGFTGGGGSGAAATATVAGGVVTGIVITNPGSCYSSAPTVTFTGGGGGSAAATALLSGRETEASCLDALEGETAVDWWLQFHDGNPGANGTANVVEDIDRVQHASTNWTTAT